MPVLLEYLRYAKINARAKPIQNAFLIHTAQPPDRVVISISRFVEKYNNKGEKYNYKEVLLC